MSFKEQPFITKAIVIIVLVLFALELLGVVPHSEVKPYSLR